MNYSKFVERIIDILQADKKFSETVSEIRFGDFGDKQDQTTANSYPLCYVTTASNPEISRRAITSAKSVSSTPSQRREFEFWVVIVVSGPTPEETQKQLYELANMGSEILEKNVQLRTPHNDDDPLCSFSQVFIQRRIEKKRGSLVEGITIRLRPVVIV